MTYESFFIESKASHFSDFGKPYAMKLNYKIAKITGPGPETIINRILLKIWGKDTVFVFFRMVNEVYFSGSFHRFFCPVDILTRNSIPLYPF